MLRSFACLTKGDILSIKYNEREYKLCVLETKPDDAVSITECDINILMVTKEKESKKRKEVDEVPAVGNFVITIWINMRGLATQLGKVLKVEGKKLYSYIGTKGVKNWTLVPHLKGSTKDKEEKEAWCEAKKRMKKNHATKEIETQITAEKVTGHQVDFAPPLGYQEPKRPEKKHDEDVDMDSPSAMSKYLDKTLIIDFAPPVGYQEPNRPEKKLDEDLDMDSPLDMSEYLDKTFTAFSGSGNRLDGKKVCLDAAPEVKKSVPHKRLENLMLLKSMY
ncbi:UFD1 [Mytilus coruscus]|uniref:UFD1 n=1 Tax=Mytilus coruscus TaxID=42192 RepID=A0A6J8CXT0_MYTCO|nr:UFD1 [Mytilus coruscus]